MAATTTKTDTLQEVLEKADPNTIADALRKVGAARQLAIIKVVVTGLTAASAIDITTAAVKAAATITGVTLETGEQLPPIGDVTSLRVTASGTAGSLGTYGVSDAGGTAIVPPGGASAALGVALLSDDGKTLTFPNTITAFVLQYRPRSSNALSGDFAPST